LLGNGIQDRQVEPVGFPKGPLHLRCVVDIGPVCHGCDQV
jgi:hypothetical protein